MRCHNRVGDKFTKDDVSNEETLSMRSEEALRRKKNRMLKSHDTHTHPIRSNAVCLSQYFYSILLLIIKIFFAFFAQKYTLSNTKIKR